MSNPYTHPLRAGYDALMVLTQTQEHRAYLKANDPESFEQALHALDALQTALIGSETPAAPAVPSQPVEELPLSVQRYNCLLALAAGEARKGGDTARAQVLATLALAEATALTVEP